MKRKLIELIRTKFKKIASLYGETYVRVKARPLTPDEAIGNPELKDFPLLKGKERLIESRFRNHYGVAFTDQYGNWHGKLKDVLDMKLVNNFRRAVFISTLNAVMSYKGMIDKTRHCKDKEPGMCAKEIKRYLKKQHKDSKTLALVGFQPVFVKELASEFTVLCVDLDRDNIDTEKYGVIILDSNRDIESIIEWGDIVLITGSVIVNGTIDKILRIINKTRKRNVYFYGVTVAGVSQLMGWNRLCFYGRTDENRTV
ncbi:MAG: DUF364 domain-containing protein [Candidatus Hydrogenedentota bacterium]